MTDRLLSDFTSAFEAHGYRQAEGVPRHHPMDRYYRHEGSTKDAGHYAALDYKPKLNSFGVRVGVSNPNVMTQLNHVLPLITKYLHPAASRAQFSEAPCWTMFDAGRRLDWDLLSIPAPIQRESWPSQLQQLVTEFLEPIFWPIKDSKGILELLLRNETPFEWFATGAVLRVAEIVALSRLAKIQSSDVYQHVRQFESEILRQMERPRDLNGFIRDLSGALGMLH